MTFKQLRHKLDKVFSEYIRRRFFVEGRVYILDVDGMAACYTCGLTRKWQQLECGHAIGGRGMMVRYDEEICRPQCQTCNQRKGGMFEVFEKYLDQEHYSGWYQEKLMQSRGIKKFSSGELRELIRQYEKINKIKRTKETISVL